MKNKSSSKVARLTTLALLIALELLMAFTPIGYLHIGLTSITLISVPVAVGAIVLGPLAGGILGGVFGLTSFYQCFGMDPFGVLLMGISPVGTFVLCFVPRLLMGILVGWLFRGLSRIRGKRFPTVAAIFACAFTGLAAAVILYRNAESAWMYLFAAVAAVLIGFLYHFVATLDPKGAPAVLSSCAAAVFNTVLFVGTLVAVFGSNPQVQSFCGVTNVWKIVELLITLNAVIEAAACLILGTAVSKALLAVKEKIAPAPKDPESAE